ncbi:hypothetical protein M5689_007076 [Euphorbia peplus]|nr:hypothetical protein M5689_007076 [Euphorbia peplus]
MSQSSFQETEQEQVSESENKKKPEWLEEFLRRTFFEACEIHPIRRNETNRYCINCNLSACQYCMSSPTHRHHNILKIYRHVYKDVVSLSSMEDHFDCSQIQPYKCNKQLVISLNPLPHCGIQSNNGVCYVCGRRLAEPHLYHYCSISCKDAAFGMTNMDPPFLCFQNQTKTDEEHENEKPKRKRKAPPSRAPFF